MKKNLIASAVAATVLSTSAFAADTATNMPTVYGDIELYMAYGDPDFANPQGTGGVNGGGIQDDNDSTLGFMHSHDLSPSTKGFYKLELDYSVTNFDEVNLDEVYIGVEGDFGKVWGGNDDSLYELVDIVDVFENLNQTQSAGDVAGVQEKGTIKYMSPGMSGFKLGFELQASEVGKGNNASDLGVLYAGFATDALTVNFAYAATDDKVVAAEDTIGLSAGFAISDAFTIAGQIESQKDNKDYIALQGAFTMGANVFNVLLASTMDDTAAENDIATFAMNAVHNHSENLYSYVELGYDSFDNDINAQGDDTQLELVVGATYHF